MTFRLTADADEDYFAIYRIGCEMFGVLQAERYADELDRVFALLGDFPRLARERREIDPPVRAHPMKSHIIVYQIEADESVTILRIRHASEDWTRDPV